jgi:hypothetical protein
MPHLAPPGHGQSQLKAGHLNGRYIIEWAKKDSGSARKEKQQIRKHVPPPESP